MRLGLLFGGCVAPDGPSRQEPAEPPPALTLGWVDPAPLALIEDSPDQHHAVLARQDQRVALVVQGPQRSVLTELSGEPPRPARQVGLDRFFDHPALAPDPAGGWLVAGRDRYREELLVRSVLEGERRPDPPEALPAQGVPVFPDLGSDGEVGLVATMTLFGAGIWRVEPAAAAVVRVAEVRNPSGWQTGSPSVAAAPELGFLVVGSRRGPDRDELWAARSDGFGLETPWTLLELDPWELEARIQVTAFAGAWAVAWRHGGQAAFGLLAEGGAPEGVVVLGAGADRPVVASWSEGSTDLLLVAWEEAGSVYLGAWEPAAASWRDAPLEAGPGVRPDLVVVEDWVWLTWELGEEGARRNQLRRARLR